MEGGKEEAVASGERRSGRVKSIRVTSEEDGE
jgi:hypothetical protein